MKLKIAVVELEGHAECLYSFCKMFENYSPKIYIFSNKAVYEELKNALNLENFEWQVQENGIAIQDFLEKQLTTINKCHVVLLNTVQKQLHQYYNLTIKPPIIWRIHNANAFLDRKNNMQFQFSPYMLWKDFSYIIRELLIQTESSKIKKMLNFVHFICFPNTIIENHVLQKKHLNESKIFPAIPLSCSLLGFEKTEINKQFNVTITGTIDERRKDYKLVLEAFALLLPKLKRPLQLTFLGQPKGPYGHRIVKAFRELMQKYESFKFVSFQKRVPQDEFNAVMRQTDLLLAPILLQTRYKIYKEQYGLTKISGSASDVIRYMKPAIFPKAYPLNNILKNVIDTYENVEDLAFLLEKKIHQFDFLEEKQAALQTLKQHYQPENMLLPILENLKNIAQT